MEKQGPPHIPSLSLWGKMPSPLTNLEIPQNNQIFQMAAMLLSKAFSSNFFQLFSLEKASSRILIPATQPFNRKMCSMYQLKAGVEP